MRCMQTQERCLATAHHAPRGTRTVRLVRGAERVQQFWTTPESHFLLEDAHGRWWVALSTMHALTDA